MHCSNSYDHYFQRVITITITTFCFLTIGFGQNAKDAASWETIIQSSTFTEVNNPKKIDKSLLSKFPGWKKMSRRNGKFNGSDVGAGPRRRIYFIAKSGNRWIVSYEHGGLGYHTHCFLTTIDSENNLDIQESNVKFESLDYLKMFIKSDHALFTQWAGYEY
jgi:hypothetical protein